MGSLFVAIVVMAVVPLIFKRAFVGVLAWSWLSFMYPHRLVYGFATRFPFLDVVAGSTILSALFSRDKKRFPAHPVLIPFILYALWVCITTVFAADVELAAGKLSNVMKAMLLGLMVPILITTRHRMIALMMAIGGSFGFYALKGGAFTLATGGQFNVMGPMGTFIQDRNDLALALVMCVPLFRYLHIHAPHKILRLGALGLMLGASVAVIGSQSRGGLIAIALVGLWLILTSRHRFGLLCAAGIMVVFTISFMPDSWRERMETVETYQEDGSAMGRLHMWRYGIELADNHPLGIGFRAYKNRAVAAGYLPQGIKLRASHSIYFEVLGEHGYVGLFLFLFLYAAAFFSFWDTRRKARRNGLYWAADLASMMQASLVAYAIGGAFLEVASFDLAFQIVGISMALGLIVQETLKEREAAKAPAPVPFGLRRPQPVGQLAATRQGPAA
ncbi:putative O-glycosylation ligase, exosortase A system-associated [Pedomonas mirosovicensis]|uniref:putative O-glycosylation ligase, exosortase A system-associated n=1 Tax=Pedomonas mirosovicensis TaxID=2908641 RepID=UPI00216A794A|nr:putative O-glycosylation ligase, exosortase A system-associated [Pedomonas mirosovicensis]MCH8684309.1 putative O-glycosylation ligase, exosortase A system-associated [Pedomonas mirosovicensis]